MKQTKICLAIAICLLSITACKKGDHIGHHDFGGHVYTLSNQAKGNSVMDYMRSVNGMLTLSDSYATGGNGSGAGLGSQGAIALADDDYVLAVNAGSNSISALKITGHGLDLKSVMNSGGEMPISLTVYGHLVYVLNAGGDGNISGFALDNGGHLHAVPNSTKPLSAPMPGPAQISFVQDGKVLAITEKGTNKITTYTMDNYVPDAMHTLTSVNTTPFGFGVGWNGNIFVSEAAGGAPDASTVSAYHVGNDGMISLINGPVAANQTAACWVVVTENNKYAYATNTGSNNVSSFSINGASGHLDLLAAAAATSGMTPIDAALSEHSKYLYVLNAGSHSISSYVVNDDGSLTDLQTTTGLPETAVGLAAE